MVIVKESYRELSQHSPFTMRRHDVSNYISPSFGKSFMKIRSAVPENGSHIFDGRKKQKKTKKHLQNIYASASYRKAIA